MTKSEKSTEILLQEAERRLRELQRIANVGSWEWDIATNEIWWSDQIFSIFGVDPGGKPYLYEDFLEAVHPDDRKAVQDAVEEALEGNAPYDIVHRITRPDGKIRYLRELAEISRDEDGTPEKMAGTVQDITERYVAEKALQMSEGRLATIIDIAPEAVVATDLDATSRY